MDINNSENSIQFQREIPPTRQMDAASKQHKKMQNTISTNNLRKSDSNCSQRHCCKIRLAYFNWSAFEGHKNCKSSFLQADAARQQTQDTENTSIRFGFSISFEALFMKRDSPALIMHMRD